MGGELRHVARRHPRRRAWGEDHSRRRHGEVIDLHELRLASIEKHLPPALFLLLLALGALSVAFLAWSFGAASHRGRVPMVLLALLIGAVLLLIMDVNRPQRRMIAVGVTPLERAAESISEETR